MSRGGDRDFVQMTFRTVEVFDADGNVDLAVFDQIVELALRDGVFDEEERMILRRIIAQVESATLGEELVQRVKQLRERHGV